MAGEQYRNGLMDKATHEETTVRLLGSQALSTAKPSAAKKFAA
jgi:hypothetical protein